jgi:hypothetical protein
VVPIEVKNILMWRKRSVKRERGYKRQRLRERARERISRRYQEKSLLRKPDS